MNMPFAPAAKSAVNVRDLVTPKGVRFWLVEDYAVPIVSLEFAMRGRKPGDDFSSLRARERADGIDEAASRFYGSGDMIKQLLLNAGKFANVGRRQGPSGMRVALPGADSAARGIDEHAVETCSCRRLRPAVPEDGAVIEHLGAGGAFL